VTAPAGREEIRSALAARGLSPRHRWGQNFLVRGDVLDEIVATAEVLDGDVVLEVGPGTGGLTERLLACGAQVIAAEVDRGLAALLGDVLSPTDRLSVVVADVMALKSALSEEVLGAVSAASGAGPWKVVSNLPYQISSPFLSALPFLSVPPDPVVVTVQKEVADVLLAEPGTDAYSPLSFLARLAWRVRRIRKLSAHSFWPVPQVASAVVRLDRAQPRPVPLVRTLELARRLFQGRRKALRTTLARALEISSADAEGRLQRAGIPPEARIETVAPEAIEGLVEPG